MIGEVRKIDPFDPAATATTIATGLAGVNPITFNDQGRLFVALDFFGSAGYMNLIQMVCSPTSDLRRLGHI